jgi:hypothetical protein
MVILIICFIYKAEKIEKFKLILYTFIQDIKNILILIFEMMQNLRCKKNLVKFCKYISNYRHFVRPDTKLVNS